MTRCTSTVQAIKPCASGPRRCRTSDRGQLCGAAAEALCPLLPWAPLPRPAVPAINRAKSPDYRIWHARCLVGLPRAEAGLLPFHQSKYGPPPDRRLPDPGLSAARFRGVFGAAKRTIRRSRGAPFGALVGRVL